MALKRMDNVGIVVEDLDATIDFFRTLGLELEGRATIEGEWAGRVTGLGDQHVEIAMMRTPDGHSRLELCRFLRPAVVADHRNAPVNALGYPPLSILHQALQDLRLIRHYKGKAVLTKAGRSILGNHGALQAFLIEWILAAPLQETLSPEAAALFWDLRHMLGVVSNRMGDWVTLGTFTEWALPVELFPGRGPFGPRHEASFFIAYNFIRPLTWLGLLQNSPQNTPSLAVTDRQFRKSEIFDKVIKITLPNDIWAIGVH